MKILVMSDSHSALSFMRYCIDRIKPAHVIHLGDHYGDGEAMQEEYRHIRFHQVPGNCDSYRRDPWISDVLCYEIGGVRFYMTHGHMHAVKSGNSMLVDAAKSSGAQIALYGHTHEPECFQVDGMWVMNPGACRSYGGTVGFVEIEDKRITSCRILRQEDAEAFA